MPDINNALALSDRQKVELLEDEMRRHETRVEIPVRHHFASSLYAREITIPAGTLLTGRVHRYAQLNILSGGKISVLTDHGMKHVEAPFTVVSPPGTKRIAYAHTECTWTTILATEETDPDVIEAQFTVATEQEFLEFVEGNNDYLAAIAGYGFDHATARRISENTADQIPMPDGPYKFAVLASAIEGQGVLAVSEIAPGEIVGPARLKNKRTPLGRYTNHAKVPNAVVVVKDNSDVDLVAIKPIQPGEEITIDYRQAGEAQKVPKRRIVLVDWTVGGTC